MRIAHPIAALLVLAPATAFASGSIECETTDGSDIVLIANMGREPDARIDAVVLTVGTNTWSTRDTSPEIRIAYYAATSAAITLDLMGPGNDRLELRIVVVRDDASGGTLTFRESSHPVRCEFG